MDDQIPTTVYFKYDISDADDIDSPWCPAEIDPFRPDSETCVVCGNEIIVEFVKASTWDDLFTLPSDGLNLLSKIFKISPTIHKDAGVDCMDELVAERKSGVRIYLYCLNCLTAINDSLTLLVQIEDLQKQVATLRSTLKSSLVSTFKKELVNKSNTGEDEDDAKFRIKSERGWHNEIDATKSFIRKSYVQCLTNCAVHLEKCKELPSLSNNFPRDIQYDIGLGQIEDDVSSSEKNEPICTRTRKKIKEEKHLELTTENTEIVRSSPPSLLTDSLLQNDQPNQDHDRYDYFDQLNEDSSSSESNSGSFFTPASPVPNTDYDDKGSENKEDEVEVIEASDTNLHESKSDSNRYRERKRWLTERGILTITRSTQIRKDYRYKCDVCGKRYYIKQRFDMHVQCHKGEWNSGDSKFEVQPKPTTSKIKLRNSRVQILSRNAKKMHKSDKRFKEIFRIKHHRQNGILPYKCKVCGKGYRREKQFKIHQECHKLDVVANADMVNALQENNSNDNCVTIKNEGPSDPIITNVWSTASTSANATVQKRLSDNCEEGCGNSNHLLMEKSKQDTFPYVCPTCGKSYKFRKSFETHLNSHEEEVYNTNNVMESDQHIVDAANKVLEKDVLQQPSAKKQEIKDYPYRCAVCNKGYFIQDYLNLHEQTYHQNDEEDGKMNANKLHFPCLKCDAKFTTQKYLNYHDIKMHRYPFTTAHNQVGHLVSFKCGWCTKEFEKVNYMTDSGEWYFKCDKGSCGKQLLNFISFSWHHGGCCDERPPRLPSDQLFQCEYCGKHCKTLANLEAHRASIHTKQFQFYCEKCGTGFSTASALKAHMLCHEEGHAFSCDKCGKTFKRKRLLVNHIKMHNNDRRFVCTICGKRFVTALTLKNHEATHTAVKNTPCPICNKMFANKNYVWEHVYSIHERRRPPRKKKPTSTGSRTRKVKATNSINSTTETVTMDTGTQG